MAQNCRFFLCVAFSFYALQAFGRTLFLHRLAKAFAGRSGQSAKTNRPSAKAFHCYQG